MTTQLQIARLTLQIQRDLVARQSLKTMLTASSASLAGRRQELRELKALIARAAARSSHTRKSGRTK